MNAMLVFSRDKTHHEWDNITVYEPSSTDQGVIQIGTENQTEKISKIEMSYISEFQTHMTGEDLNTSESMTLNMVKVKVEFSMVMRIPQRWICYHGITN